MGAVPNRVKLDIETTSFKKPSLEEKSPRDINVQVQSGMGQSRLARYETKKQDKLDKLDLDMPNAQTQDFYEMGSENGDRSNTKKYKVIEYPKGEIKGISGKNQSMNVNQVPTPNIYSMEPLSMDEGSYNKENLGKPNMELKSVKQPSETILLK